MAFETEEDLLAAANSREAEEGDHLELKRELPPAGPGLAGPPSCGAIQTP